MPRFPESHVKGWLSLHLPCLQGPLGSLRGDSPVLRLRVLIEYREAPSRRPMCGPQDPGSRHSGPWAQSTAAGVLGGPQRAGKDAASGPTLPAACPFPSTARTEPVPTALSSGITHGGRPGGGEAEVPARVSSAPVFGLGDSLLGWLGAERGAPGGEQGPAVLWDVSGSGMAPATPGDQLGPQRQWSCGLGPKLLVVWDRGTLGVSVARGGF